MCGILQQTKRNHFMSKINCHIHTWASWFLKFILRYHMMISEVSYNLPYMVAVYFYLQNPDIMIIYQSTLAFWYLFQRWSLTFKWNIKDPARTIRLYADIIQNRHINVPSEMFACKSITMKSWWAWWRLKSPASPLFTQPCIQVQIKENIKASLVFVRGIHRSPVNSPHKWPVTRKMFPFDDVIMS